VSCSPRTVRLTARFRLDVPEDEVLVDYVAGRLDLGTNRSQGGSSSLAVLVFAPEESEPIDVAVDGEWQLTELATERGHQVMLVRLEMAPRQWHVIEAEVEVDSGRPLLLRTQPLVRPQTQTVTDSCGASSRL
jgi:hypothetical protein